MARQIRVVATIVHTVVLLLVIAASWTVAQPAAPVNTNPTCNLDGSSANVAFTTSGNNRIINSNLCPDHAIRTINPNAARSGDAFGIFNQQYPVPLAPTLAPTNQIINVTCLGGPIGIIRSGAVVESVFAGGGCGGDAVKSEGFTFDECGGHSDQANRYHYHVTPSCTLSSYTTSTSQHSPILGYLFDGIPIYGPRGDNGSVPTDLDACGGHASDSGNGGHYHYHFKPLTGALPDPATPLSQAAISSVGAGFPYTPGCMRGCVPDQYLNNWRNMGVTTQTSYASCVAAGTPQAQAESIGAASAVPVTPTTTTTTTTTARAVTTTTTAPTSSQDLSGPAPTSPGSSSSASTPFGFVLVVTTLLATVLLAP